MDSGRQDLMDNTKKVRADQLKFGDEILEYGFVTDNPTITEYNMIRVEFMGGVLYFYPDFLVEITRKDEDDE